MIDPVPESRRSSGGGDRSDVGGSAQWRLCPAADLPGLSPVAAWSSGTPEAVDWDGEQLAMGTRAVATCAVRRQGGRAWRVRRDLEGAAAVLAAASRGRWRWGGGRSIGGAAGRRDGGRIGGGFNRIRQRRLGRTAAWAAVVRARWRRAPRRRRYETAVTSGPSLLSLPFHGNPRSGFPCPLSC